MRYLAWIAIFSLQMSMFVCESGIDVCLGSDVPAHVESTQASLDHSNFAIDATCSAHAAHVFLGAPAHHQAQAFAHNQASLWLSSLNILKFFKRIEQPPQLLHS